MASYPDDRFPEEQGREWEGYSERKRAAEHEKKKTLQAQQAEREKKRALRDPKVQKIITGQAREIKELRAQVCKLKYKAEVAAKMVSAAAEGTKKVLKEKEVLSAVRARAQAKRAGGKRPNKARPNFPGPRGRAAQRSKMPRCM